MNTYVKTSGNLRTSQRPMEVPGVPYSMATVPFTHNGAPWRMGFERAVWSDWLLVFSSLYALQDILSYHKRSHQRLSPGLYLGYLKLCSSVDQIKVLVTQRLPNILCHVKIRENHNISK